MAEEDGEGGFNMDSDGKYHLQIISASDLMKKDLFGASDPYVRVFAVYHSPNGETRKTEVAKTRTIKNNLNPDWSEGFTVTINADLDYILDFFLLVRLHFVDSSPDSYLPGAPPHFGSD